MPLFPRSFWDCWTQTATVLAILLVAWNGRPAQGQTVFDFSPAYLRAVADAEQIGAKLSAGQPIDPSRIAHNLTTLNGVPSAPTLMSAFTDFTGYDRNYVDSPFRRSPLFVTSGTQLYDFIRSNGVPQTALDLRVKQWLGLPENLASDRVVELIADQKDILRPQRDPSVTNPNSATSFPDGINPSYITYFNETLVDSRYAMPPGRTPFPFTQLGYTYDYGNPETVIGPSEFIILSQSAPNPVTDAPVDGIRQVVSVVSLLSYRYYDREGNFDVAGDIDTLWAGTRYTPQGSQIVIRPGATVEQGITISSTGYTLINDGRILGPGKSLDRTFRDGVIELEHGGTIINSGTIDGAIGIFAARSVEDVFVRQTAGTISGYLFSMQLGFGNDHVRVEGGNLDGALDGGPGTNDLLFDLGPGRSLELHSNIVNFQQVTIATGQIQLNGTVGGDVLVQPGGRLSGVAVIGGNLTSSGAVDPGLGDGRSNLHVAGNYIQEQSSVLDIHLAKPLADAAESNRLAVGGNVTLAAGSTISIDHVAGGQDVFRSGDRFPIITAARITNDGVTLTSSSAFLTFSGALNNAQTTYTLRMNRTASFASVASPGNHTALATALDEQVEEATGPSAAVFNELLFMSSLQFNEAAGQLLPTPYFDALFASDRTTQYLHETLGQVLRNRFLLPVADCGVSGEGSDDDGWHGFTTPFGMSYGQSSVLDQPGFTANTAGVLTGVDRFLNEETIAGLQFGYGHTFLSLRDGFGGGGLDNYRVGPYLGWFSEGWFFDAAPSYGYHSSQLTRSVTVGALSASPSANWSASDASMFLEGGRSFDVGEVSLLPFASLQYIHLWQNGFTETGGAGTDLALDAAQLQSLRSRLMLQASREYCWNTTSATPGIYAGWAHEALSHPAFVAGLASSPATFTTRAPVWYRDSALLGTLLNLRVSSSIQLGVRYQAELFGSIATIHYGEGSLTCRF